MGRGFEHFELEVLRQRFLVAGQQFGQAQRKVGLLQVTCRDVDADRDVEPVAAPLREVVERLRQHPIADARRQAGVLDQGQKLQRRDHPLLRVVPAQQGFEAEHAAAAHVHLGLVVEDELLLVQGLLHATDGHHALFGAAAVFGVEEQVAVAAGLLGAVHRMVGVAQQGVGIAAVDRVDRGAHARGDLHRVLRGIHHIGLRDHAQHAFDRQARFFQRAGAQ